MRSRCEGRRYGFPLTLSDFASTERLHRALAVRCLAELYRSSPSPYRGLEDLEFPFGAEVLPKSSE